MDVCEIYQLAYSQFLDWDLDDQHKAVMHQLYKAERCGQCGTHHDEWVDPDTGRRRPELPYVAVSRTCWGCEALAQGEKELEELRQDPTKRVPGGTRVRLERPKPGPDPAGQLPGE